LEDAANHPFILLDPHTACIGIYANNIYFGNNK